MDQELCYNKQILLLRRFPTRGVQIRSETDPIRSDFGNQNINFGSD